MAILMLASCSGGPPSAVIGLQPEIDPASVPGANRVDVFVATSRAPDADERVLFSGERSDTTGFAQLSVWIPPNHETGRIERPTTLPPDPRNHFVITDPVVFSDEPKFVRAVDQDLATRPRDEQNILYFIHGYNTDFTSAVFRIAQFVHDSGFDGTPVLFTWASRGRTLDYVYDLNSTLHARDALLQSAQALGSGTRVKSVDVLAHSMGNLLTVEAIRQSALTGTFNRRGRINSIILAAPDIDIDLFARQLSWVPRNDPPIYVLTSSDDRALRVSRRLAGNVDRVGAASPDELSGLPVNVIDLSAVSDTESIHHTKFAGAPEVVKLIGAGILSGSVLPDREAEDGALVNLGGAAAGILVLPATVLTGGRVRVHH